MLSLTHKIDGKRVMKVLPVWTCAYKSNREKWFDRICLFVGVLSSELGFRSETSSTQKVWGSGTYRSIHLTHIETGVEFKICILKISKSDFGCVCFIEVEDNIGFITTKQTIDGKYYEPPTSIGNYIIETMRDNWPT